MKKEYLMAKIDVYHSLLPSDRVIGWDMKLTSHPNSNASFINIWDRLIWRRSPNLTRSSKLAAAPNWQWLATIRQATPLSLRWRWYFSSPTKTQMCGLADCCKPLWVYNNNNGPNGHLFYVGDDLKMRRGMLPIIMLPNGDFVLHCT